MVYGTQEDIETTTTTTGTAWLRNITAQGEMSGSGGFGVGVGVGVGVAGGPSLAAAQQGQGVAALLVMLAVLCFIFAYCCWGAPFCRSLCRRHCCCRLEDPEPDTRFGNSDQAMVATPTIILLPHGRMLVVDGTIFTQFQTDTTGLDLVELGDSVIRAQRNSRSINRHQLQSSQGSILEMDAETPSKDSLGSVGCFPPPTYESIYGKEESDMPPSYSDILLHRFANLPHEIDMHNLYHDDKEEIEMQAMESCSRILSNPINTFPYAYAAVTSFSSQSFPRRAVSRDPSIISNPLDNFYVDDEMEMYQTRNAFHDSNSDRHREMTSFRFIGQTNENGNEPSRDDERRHSARSDDTGVARIRARSTSWISREEVRKNQENARRGSDWESTSVTVSGPSHSPTRSNATDVRNRSAEAPGSSEEREDPNALGSTTARAYSTSLGNSVISALEQNDTDGSRSEARLSSSIAVEDTASQLERARTSDSLMYSDDDAAATRNFGALADIRESRV